jgi:hypothetical protein
MIAQLSLANWLTPCFHSMRNGSADELVQAYYPQVIESYMLEDWEMRSAWFCYMMLVNVCVYSDRFPAFELVRFRSISLRRWLLSCKLARSAVMKLPLGILRLLLYFCFWVLAGMCHHIRGKNTNLWKNLAVPFPRLLKETKGYVQEVWLHGSWSTQSLETRALFQLFINQLMNPSREISHTLNWAWEPQIGS